ncbi:MAG: ABC-three component system middle component 6 [Rhizobiaceae bacterium]|nr:hypothetical protein [Thermoanaerobaculia bacterium]
MILPTKRIREDRSLVGIGGDVLRLLDEQKTVSRLWDEFRRGRADVGSKATFDWFVLALDLLFMMGIVTVERGLVRRARE